MVAYSPGMASYHAHIYFRLEEREAAERLFARARSVPGFSGFYFHPLPVGPHPHPMIELHFSSAERALARQWVVENRGSYSVLIHADTGDDFRDHSENIEWFGEPVPLDFSFFELVRNRPEFLIHPERR